MEGGGGGWKCECWGGEEVRWMGWGRGMGELSRSGRVVVCRIQVFVCLRLKIPRGASIGPQAVG